jgi:UDP-N-acetylglucosamine 2-epimerase
MKLASVVGARPNFVKLAAVDSTIRSFSEHIIIHTGQHYDYRLSEIFFKELDIPKPDFNLEVGSGPPGVQSGNILKKLQPIFSKDNKFDAVLVYGTNSTFAGALCAAKSGCIHPRTSNFLKRVKLFARLRQCKNVRVVKPVGYIDFIALMLQSK